MSQVWVVGEALMDLIPVAGGEISEMVGGGPCNSAKALSRLRSEERRVGKECNGQCRSRWSPYH